MAKAKSAKQIRLETKAKLTAKRQEERSKKVIGKQIAAVQDVMAKATQRITNAIPDGLAVSMSTDGKIAKGIKPLMIIVVHEPVKETKKAEK